MAVRDFVMGQRPHRGRRHHGRPVARQLDDGLTAECGRLCTDGTFNACSLLYAAAWRAARAIGYVRLLTYTRTDELGSSPAAANFRLITITDGGTWHRRKRPRQDSSNEGRKFLWRVG